MEEIAEIKYISKSKIEAELCRRSFYRFVKSFWEVIITEPPVWNWHIKYLCDLLQHIGIRVKNRLPKEYDYYIINVPPGSLKSTIVSEMYPIWCWVIDPSQKFICGSYSSTVAEDLASKSYNIFHSEKFQKLFPKLHSRKPSGGKTHFHNGWKGERYTTSSGSMIQGIHAHQKLLDDIIGRMEAHSKVERKKVNDWLSETISTRNVDAKISTTILVMQRLHKQDPTGYLLDKEGLKIFHVCLPVELTPDVKPLELSQFYVNGLFDPERKPRERLIVERTELGSYGYAGQMLQRPSPAEGGIIKKEWFNISERAELPPMVKLYFQMDTAYTEDEMNDPSGILAYYIENNNLYIVNAISVYKEFPDLIRWLNSYTIEKGYRNTTSKIYVEPKASGKSVVQTIRAISDLNIIESKAPTEDKISRLNIVSPKIESGRVFLHRGGWNDSFINQVTDFPNADHDEYVDCLVAIIIRELIDTNFNYSTLNALL